MSLCAHPDPSSSSFVPRSLVHRGHFPLGPPANPIGQNFGSALEQWPKLGMLRHATLPVEGPVVSDRPQGMTAANIASALGVMGRESSHVDTQHSACRRLARRLGRSPSSLDMFAPSCLRPGAIGQSGAALLELCADVGGIIGKFARRILKRIGFSSIGSAVLSQMSRCVAVPFFSRLPSSRAAQQLRGPTQAKPGFWHATRMASGGMGRRQTRSAPSPPTPTTPSDQVANGRMCPRHTGRSDSRGSGAPPPPRHVNRSPSPSSGRRSLCRRAVAGGGRAPPVPRFGHFLDGPCFKPCPHSNRRRRRCGLIGIPIYEVGLRRVCLCDIPSVRGPTAA